MLNRESTSQRHNSQGQTYSLPLRLAAVELLSHDRVDSKVPVSVVGKFHLICFQLGEQQHQNLYEYKENNLQHT